MTEQTTVLQTIHPPKVPGHSMYGDWALPGRPYSYIALIDLVARELPGKAPALVALSDICAKPGDWFGTDDFCGPRFERADPRYPGLLVRNMPNPCQLPFRMIDGRRRLEKIRLRGDLSAHFYVFELAEVEPFILDYTAIGA